VQIIQSKDAGDKMVPFMGPFLENVNFVKPATVKGFGRKIDEKYFLESQSNFNY
jgi:hypothetical protein